MRSAIDNKLDMDRKSIFLLLCLCAGFLIQGIAARCLFGDGPDCFYKCHCLDKTECGGSCPSGCDTAALGYNWGGPACQIGNVALGKPADQNGTCCDAYANEAVDGIFASRDLESCAHPTVRGHWWVELGGLFNVYSVTIYFRQGNCCDDRNSGFTISVRNSSTESAECANQHSQATKPSQTFTCSTPLVGREVDFIKPVGDDASTLCEVIVMGHQYTDCSVCPDGVYCDDVTGCLECNGAYRPECKQECDDSYYGTNCLSKCGRCNDNVACDKSSGICPEGCQVWWITDKCQVELERPVPDDTTVTVKDTLSSSISVTWKKLSISEDIAQHYGYLVQVREDGASEYTVEERVMHQIYDGSFDIDGLLYNRNYDLKVTPYRKWGNTTDPGTPYSQISQKTKCAKPDQPSEPYMNVTSANTEVTSELRITYQNISTINSKCDAIRKVLLKVYMNEDELSSTDLAIKETYYAFQLNVSGSYKAQIIIENNMGLTSTSGYSNIIFWEPVVTTDGPNLVIIISVVVIGLLVIVAAVLATVFILRKRRQKQDNSKGKLSSTDSAYLELDGNVNLGMKSVDEDEDPVKNISPRNDIETTKSSHPNLSPISNPVPDASPYANADSYSNSPQRIELKPVAAEEHAHAPRIAKKETRETIPKPQTTPPSEQEHIYGNTLTPPVKPEPVNVADFEAYVNQKKSADKPYTEEYNSLPQDDKTKCHSGQTKDNKKKNRFLNIYPYEHTRVILDVPGDQAEEFNYINANYIRGFTKDKEYIATQGPKDITVGDFWRMIWQEGANRIVMVANVEENGKLRSHPYWSDTVGSTITQGLFKVTTDGIEVCADYTTRILTIMKRNESRTVRQFHFTSWEDKNKPLYGATTLLSFYRKVHGFDRFSKGPMIVHCSAGVGRTGTFIAFDILQQQVTKDRIVYVYGCVERLRGERMSMVQTKEQYIFLHDALVEYIQCGDTSYSCGGFEKTLTKLCDPGQRGVSELEIQFKVLTKMKGTSSNEEMDGYAPVHKAKNRDLAMIPADKDRPRLIGRINDNYINAVFVDGFKVHDLYVVTQTPLPGTIADFWRLVFGLKSKSIVMLNQIDEDDEMGPPYWPTEDKPTQTYGPIEVTLVKTNYGNKLDTIITRDFNVKNKLQPREEGVVVRHFQLLTWPNTDSVTPHKADILDLLGLLQDWQQQNTNSTDAGNIIVHCLTGGVQSGVFCGVIHTLDRMKVEQEIDAFLAVRYVTRRRPQFFTTLAEYQFMYEMAIQCMSQYDTYANFQ